MWSFRHLAELCLIHHPKMSRGWHTLFADTYSAWLNSALLYPTQFELFIDYNRVPVLCGWGHSSREDSGSVRYTNNPQCTKDFCNLSRWHFWSSSLSCDTTSVSPSYIQSMADRLLTWRFLHDSAHLEPQGSRKTPNDRVKPSSSCTE